MVSDTTFEHISVRHSGGEADEIIAASFKLLANIPQLTDSVEASAPAVERHRGAGLCGSGHNVALG